MGFLYILNGSRFSKLIVRQRRRIRREALIVQKINGEFFIGTL